MYNKSRNIFSFTMINHLLELKMVSKKSYVIKNIIFANRNIQYTVSKNDFFLSHKIFQKPSENIQLHLKTKLVSNYLSFSFNNFIESLARGEDSSVDHINRYPFQCSLDCCGKGSKIFPSYLLIQSIFSIGFRYGIFAGIVNFHHIRQIWRSHCSVKDHRPVGKVSSSGQHFT